MYPVTDAGWSVLAQNNLSGSAGHLAICMWAATQTPVV